MFHKDAKRARRRRLRSDVVEVAIEFALNLAC